MEVNQAEKQSSEEEKLITMNKAIFLNSLFKSK